MSVENRLAELERRHQSLEKEIQSCEAHPAEDTIKIARLERRKLQIRDEMMKMRQTPAQPAQA